MMRAGVVATIQFYPQDLLLEKARLIIIVYDISVTFLAAQILGGSVLQLLWVLLPIYRVSIEYLSSIFANQRPSSFFWQASTTYCLGSGWNQLEPFEVLNLEAPHHHTRSVLLEA